MMRTENQNSPNILWISLEDTTPRFGCYGDPIARTPHIDRLAASGRRFPNAFSTAGVCAPSRSAIITGMYQTSIGTHHMRTTHTNRYTPEMPTPYSAVPPHYVKTFTEYLRAAGYYCTNNSKTDYQFPSPITAWDECSDEAHWRNRADGQPFFSVFNPTVTHESGMWPRDDRPLITDPSAVKLPPYLPDTPKAREALAHHYDNLAIADERVGQILGELRADGLAENTIVFLWSDHGEGLPRGKRWPYDAGIRIPLLVRWPGQLEPGSVCEDLVSLIDLGPTVLSLAGIELPSHLQGQPFLGPRAIQREYVFATRDRYDESYEGSSLLIKLWRRPESPRPPSHSTFVYQSRFTRYLTGSP
jgi:arylsulfatase A-like enzyme